MTKFNIVFILIGSVTVLKSLQAVDKALNSYENIKDYFAFARLERKQQRKAKSEKVKKKKIKSKNTKKGKKKRRGIEVV